MILRETAGPSFTKSRANQRASVLIIVLWVAFGLVTLTVYFANSTSLELRAADNQLAGLEAEKAIEAAARYVSNILANVEQPGVLPDTNRYATAAVPVGDAMFWLIGRGNDWEQDAPTAMHFGLVDESSKLNLNTATTNMLLSLPRMTVELAASILDWRDSNNDVSQNGAESDFYMRLNPPYRCKNASFETVDELRLVSGAYLDLLYGEDANLNGALDRNENDGEANPPFDLADGRLEPGFLEYFTVYSRTPGAGTNGTQRLNVGANNFRQQAASLLQEKLGVQRANAILRQFTPAGGGGGRGGNPQPTVTFGSVLEFYLRSGMTEDEFQQIEEQLRNPNTNGMVNVNTASEAVLACLPGLDFDKAQSLVAQRRGRQASELNSVAWVKDVIDQASALRAGPFLTGRSYQVSADIAAVGRFGRGYKREKFVFDTSSGTPRIVYRQDLTHMGWALGPGVLKARQTLAGNFR